MPDWPGGYLRQHASRVVTDVPAPYNLAVPPYHFPKADILRIDEDPVGQTLDFNSILQI